MSVIASVEHRPQCHPLSALAACSPIESFHRVRPDTSIVAALRSRARWMWALNARRYDRPELMAIAAMFCPCHRRPRNEVIQCRRSNEALCLRTG
jgi:hypothetical protein